MMDVLVFLRHLDRHTAIFLVFDNDAIVQGHAETVSTFKFQVDARDVQNRHVARLAVDLSNI